MKKKYILGIDQGTTSNRAVIFDCDSGKIIKIKAKEFSQSYPKNGWVEHDIEEIWSGVLTVIKEVLIEAQTIKGFTKDSIAGLGITNQRETTVVWNKLTGKSIYPAIVWQDRRTAASCEALKKQGVEKSITIKTGLPVDPYFCASKIQWILDNVPEAKTKASRGELAFGTIDSFLIWRLTSNDGLTNGIHLTEITNASRTNLYNIDKLAWDEELLKLYDIPANMLAEVKPCNHNFGTTSKKHFGLQLPICGIAGDQQASLFGQACFEKGMMKSTYGTGAFLLINSGHNRINSKNKLLSTIGYQLTGEKVLYALEGSIFIAGAAMKWLKENLGMFENYSDSQSMAANTAENDIFVVPAFSGLGAPYWDPNARGAIFGITRSTSKAAIVKATLQAMAYQTSDIFSALQKDGIAAKELKVDGGLTQNTWLLQFMANILGVNIIVPESHETTIIGACFLAAIGARIYSSTTDAVSKWNTAGSYTPNKNFTSKDKLLAQWNKAVTATRSF